MCRHLELTGLQDSSQLHMCILQGDPLLTALQGIIMRFLCISYCWSVLKTPKICASAASNLFPEWHYGLGVAKSKLSDDTIMNQMHVSISSEPNFDKSSRHLPSIVPLALSPILQSRSRSRQALRLIPLPSHLPRALVHHRHTHHNHLPHNRRSMDGNQWLRVLCSYQFLLEPRQHQP